MTLGQKYYEKPTGKVTKGPECFFVFGWASCIDAKIMWAGLYDRGWG